MRMLLIAGHGGSDPGAVGNGYREADLTREVAALLQPLLNRFCDCDVFDTTLDCYTYLKNGGRVDFSKYDYVLEIHFNSVEDESANGTEILVHTSEKSVSVEQRIVNAVALLGFKNRGVRRRSDLRVMNSCKKVYGTSHALLEVCFIKNRADMDNYQDKKQHIAESIAHAIKEGFGLNDKEKVLLTSANDITWELSQNYFPISDTDGFVLALEKAKAENSPLYWGFYKLVNQIQ